MARDCYQVFKSIYNQAIADGLAVTVATAAAQAAQQDCLQQQSVRVSAAQPIVVVDSQTTDPGPTAGQQTTQGRASALGVAPDKANGG